MLISLALGVLGLALLAVVMSSRGLRGAPGWRSMAFVAFFALPVLFAASAIQANLTHMKSVEFCGSCHVMTPYVESLRYDDDEPLSSVHFRNNYVEQEHACYSCHVSYAMFGGVKAKVNGLHHVWAFVTRKEHGKIELYEPYDNGNCLHCHGSSERFRAVEDHVDEENFLARAESGELSCLSSGCHDEGHYWDGKYGDDGDEEAWPDEAWPADSTASDSAAAPPDGEGEDDE